MKFRKHPLTLLLSTISATTSTLNHAESIEEQTVIDNQRVVLPTIVIEAMAEGDPIKTYVDYKNANVTRNGLDKKDIPQTVDTIDVSKYKIYGSNDLSVMLQGTPGVSTTYDTREDGIMLRGFDSDLGDIYRDGVRESGQIRRSTANIERIEILKGPASVLYGRSAGGGVVNMVSKYANFDSPSSVGLYAGSYHNIGATLDLNQAVNDNFAIRLTGERGDSDSFRQGIGTKTEMISPSFTYRNDDQTLTWTTQYTYDKIDRVPDRGPNFSELPAGTSIKMGFAQHGDYIYDRSEVMRSDLNYDLSNQWKFHWAVSYREAFQNFDHFYAGYYCNENNINSVGKACQNPGTVNQNYYWQQTSNKTTSNSFDLKGEVYTGKIKHNIMFGADWVYEEREPILANSYVNGEKIVGFINPTTGERFNNRQDRELKINQHNYNEGSNYAVFMQDLISFNEHFKLMLGGRYDYYENTTTNKLKADGDKDQRRSVSDNTFSPNAGIIWQPTENQSFYASYSKSFSPFGGSMGVNAVSSNTNLNAFNAEPQYNDQYEIGVKSDWFDQRLNTQLSVYDIRKKNIRYKPDPENRPDDFAVAGEHQSKGIELSFIGKVLDNLYIRGGYGYTNATVKEDKETPALEGNRLKDVSKNTGNLFVRYLPLDNLYTELGYTYVGSYYGNKENTQKAAGFERIDAAIGYKNNTWSASFAVNNLTDEKYWRSTSMPGTPRNYLFRMNYYF